MPVDWIERNREFIAAETLSDQIVCVPGLRECPDVKCYEIGGEEIWVRIRRAKEEK